MSLKIIFLFASLVLCNCCWSEVNPVNERKTIKLIDLNDDVLYIILQELDLSSLTQLPTSNSKLVALANDVFYHDYKDFLIYLYYFDKETNYAVFKYEKRIEIYDSELGLSLLKRFGSLIEKLKIDNNLEDRYTESLKYANEYAADSLIYLELPFVRVSTLPLFTRPFKNVQEFRCYLDKRPNGQVQSLNLMFPQLRRFIVTFNHDVNYSLLNGIYPHLEHLDIDIMSSDTWDHRNEIELLIRNNPQLKSFGIIGLPFESSDYIPVIHQLLPNLSNLTVSSLYTGGANITFENVTYLNARNFLPGRIEVWFPRLQSLKMILNSHYFEWSRNFLRNYPHLHGLNIYSWNQRDTDHPELEELLTEQTNLTELDLLFEDEVNPHVIVRIVRNHAHLKRFNFAMRTGSYAESNANIICEQLENDWHITKIGYDESHPGYPALLMEKKEMNVLEY